MPRPSDIAAAYDAVASSYDTFYSDYGYRIEDWQLWQVIEPLLDGPDQVIDLGCGTGLLLDLAQHADVTLPRYHGVDLSAGMVAEAQRKFPDQVFEVDDALSDAFWDALPDASRRLVVALYGSLSYVHSGALLELLCSVAESGPTTILLMLYSDQHEGGDVLNAAGVDLAEVRYDMKAADQLVERLSGVFDRWLTTSPFGSRSQFRLVVGESS